MKPPRAAEYLDQMIEAAQLAHSYVVDMNVEQFMADRRTQQAVVLNIVVIGEAASRLVREQPGFADAHPPVPWRNIRGMRNRVAHGYFDIDMALVWQTVSGSLPQLIDELVRIRAELDPREPAQ